MLTHLQIVAGKKQKGNKKTPKDTKDAEAAMTADDGKTADDDKTAIGKDAKTTNDAQDGKHKDSYHNREDEWHMQRAEKMALLHQFLAKKKLSR